jgi:hypothetical protein
VIELIQRWAELAPDEIQLVPRGTKLVLIDSPAIAPVVVNVSLDGSPQESMVDIAVLGIVLKSFADRQKGKGPLDSDDIDIRLREGDYYCEIFSAEDELSSAVRSSPGLAALTAYVEYLEYQ